MSSAADARVPFCGPSAAPAAARNSPMASDEVLQAFLQGMEELDHQPTSAAVPQAAELKAEPVTPLRQARKRARREVQTASTKRVAGVEPKGRSSVSWSRRKQELHDLREQAQALESYADILQLSRMPAQFLLASESHAPCPTDEWKAMVAGEKQRVREAQKENAALKARLQTLVDASGVMQETLCVASAQREEQLARNTAMARALGRQTTTPPAFDVGGSTVFGQLERRVVGRNHEIDGILSAAQQPLVSVCSELVRIHREADEEPAVEFNSARVLPFALDAVIGAFWQAVGCQDRPLARAMKRSEDSVAVDNRFTVTLDDGRSVELRMRYVAKRFVRAESVGVLIESVTEWPDSFGDSAGETFTTRESGWAVVLRHPQAQRSSTANTKSSSRPTPCLLRFLTRLQPSTLKTSSTGSPATRGLLHTRVVNDVVIPAYRELLRSRQQVVDNLILDGARGDREYASV